MALTDEYFRLSNEYAHKYGKKTILLMQVGSFFECYSKTDSAGNMTDANMKEFCSTCDLNCSITNGRCMAGFPFSCNFRDYSLERYVKKMQELGYTIIVYVQDGQGSNTTRSLHCIYSPGTFFSSDTDSAICCLSNNTCCFWIERVNIGSVGSKIIMGMSNIDIYTGRTTCFECESEINARHNQTTYDELERFISSFQPNEVIIISNLSASHIQDIINFANIRACANPVHLIDIQSTQSTQSQSHPFYVQAKNCQKQTYRKELLGKFFSFHVCNSIFQSYSAYEFAIQSFTFLLHFMHEHNPHLTHKITEPEFENKTDRMVLANHTLEQLNIIDAVGSGSKMGKCSSVYHLLNHCKTPMGSRRFYYRLLHPSFNVAAIQREYDITEYVLGLFSGFALENIPKNKKYLIWREVLENVKDVEKLHRKIYLGKIYPKSLHVLYTSLEIINEMYKGVKCDQTLLKYVNADECPERITEFCEKMKKEIDSHFIIEKCKTIDSLDFDLKYEDCFIQPGVSKELDATFIAHEDGFSIFESIRAHCNELIALGEKTVSAGGKEKEFVKIHETEKLGLSLQTTDRRSKILLDQIAKRVKTKQCISTLSYKSIDCGTCGTLKTIDFDLSLLQFVKAGSSTVTFIHEKIHSVCSSISQTRVKIRDEIGLVFTAFVAGLKEHQESFQTVISFVTDVDLMQNQAHIACTYKYCKPAIKQNSGEKENEKEKAASFVDARDIRHCLIEQINEDELYVCNDISLGLGERGMLLYGTNAVGKTSLIRALGICIIMAQSGLYVPCSSFTYSPYTNVMTRILGNDNLFKGMSTFAVEMSELRVILKCADKNSLILGDELCSGTEIDSAISIFVAGLQKLHALKSCFVFATHMHEIVDYEEIAHMQLNRGLVTKHMAVTYDRAHDVLIYDRKLRDGAGPSMYGLEVCKSLHLPDDFLKMANDIRLKYRDKKQAGDLNFKPSHFNAHKIKGMCELCKQNLGEEVHHLQHQKEADEANFIQHFHKNHLANLMTVCESCHLKMHGTGSGQQLRRVLTTGTDGYILRGTSSLVGSETNFHEWANNM
jgi:DNA mismatch repair protein MutS